MRMDDTENVGRRGSLLLPFLVGTIAGAFAMLALAPTVRRESTEKFKDLSRDLKQRASAGFENARGRVSDLVSRGREHLDETHASPNPPGDVGSTRF